MKIVRLQLEAFGPFTDKVLDFTEGPALHLIHGPNEAGKSSALRAITDLRFGIPFRSPDNFIHPHNQLRIAGVFIDERGAQIGLRRHKGRGQTLSAFDPTSGAELAAGIGPGLERALTGGLSREEFELLFGLDHERLRAAGRRLLEGEGELGSALFEASAGTRNVGEILERLDADARGYFLQHGNAQNAIINQARRQFDLHRQALRAATMRPTEWQELKRTHEQAEQALRELEGRLEASHRTHNEHTELRAVEPLLRELDFSREAVAVLAEVPELSPEAREQRLAAEQALRAAQHNRQRAEAALERSDEALATVRIEEGLLAHAHTIERLAARSEQVGESRLQRRLHDDAIAQVERELGAAAARIAPGQTPAALLEAVPSAADRVTLNAHIEAIARADERLAEQHARRDELDAEEQADAAGAPALPDPGLRNALTRALEEARALGDITQRRLEAEREGVALDHQLTQALSDLGLGSIEALRVTRPLLDAQIVATRDVLAGIDDTLAHLRAEAQRLHDDLQTQGRRRRELAAAGEVVTADTLRMARARRDEGWALVRKAFIERSHDAAALAPAYDPDHRLPEAFEAAQAGADRQADLLRADAKRAASYAECSSRIDAMEARKAELEREALEQRELRARVHADWFAGLVAAALPRLEPEALREWAMKREAAVALAAQMAEAAARLQAMDVDSARAERALRDALTALEQPAAGLVLAQLVRVADEHDRALSRLQLETEARVRERRERALARQRIERRIEDNARERAEHRSALAEWHRRLALVPNSAPEAVQARLVELDALVRRMAELADTRQRRAEHHARIEDFEAQVAALARTLGEAVPASEIAADRVDQWKTRLVGSQDEQRRRDALLNERAQALQDKTAATAEEGAQQACLAQLCAAAGVTTPAQLPGCEEASARKRELNAALVAQQLRLAQASTRTESELRSRLADTDTPALEHALTRCGDELERLNQSVSQARSAEEQARRALEAIDGSAAAAEAREAMEAAAARLRAALRPWARLRLAHTLLQASLARFKERAQAPMVATASTYFALMTGERYPRLIVDDAEATPVLRAQRADGKTIGVEAMSEGTRDQLFLALRLAALELRRGSHPEMPLILDDVLVTSDDARAANVLRALARFAAGGQVLLFTHHQHLVEVARGVLGEERMRVVEVG